MHFYVGQTQVRIMHRRVPLFLCLYLIAIIISVCTGSAFVPKSGLIQKSLHAPSISSLDRFTTIVPRGGSLSVDEKEGSILVRKMRNIIRSILKVSEKKVPIVASIFKTVLGVVEGMTGVKLLPSKDGGKAKGKKSKPKKKKSEVSAKQSSAFKSKDKTASKSDISKMTSQAQTHLAKDLKATNPNYRIQRELKEFLKSPPPNLSVKVGKNIRVWIITLEGTKGSLYEGEKYRLRVQFPANYPTEPPSVYFLQPTPRHEHIYTNGDICLSLLGKDWRPNMTASSIAMSILSILSGAQRKSLPMDNAAHAQNKPGEKQDNWVYHDDNC